MLCSHLETPTLPLSAHSLSYSLPVSFSLSLSFSVSCKNVGNVISCVPVRKLGPWPKTPDLWSDGQVLWSVCASIMMCVTLRCIYVAKRWTCTSITKRYLRRQILVSHRLIKLAKGGYVFELYGFVHVCMCSCGLVCACARTSPCLAAGQSGMGLSLAAVVRLSQRYEACCFIGQTKLLRQGFYWRFEFCQSQMELHNRFNPSLCMCAL